MTAGRVHTLSDLVTAGLSVTRSVLRQTLYLADEDSESSLEPIQPGGRKRALLIDAIAEVSFKKLLRTHHGGVFRDIAFYGEERLRDGKLDLTGEKRLCVLVDAIDGTDLLERGLNNWCCASVFFRPNEAPGRRIQAAFVGLPNGRVYYATCDTGEVLVQAKQSKPARLAAGPSGIRDIRHASVCFYGQKPENFRSFADAGLLDAVSPRKKVCSKDGDAQNESVPASAASGHRDESLFRLYNLGGIPMMVSLVDRQVETASGIDAVVELKGQKPHDVVPGAFLALKGGAVMKKRDRSPMTVEDLESILLRPAASGVTYVLSATEELAESICAAIPWETGTTATASS